MLKYFFSLKILIILLYFVRIIGFKTEEEKINETIKQIKTPRTARESCSESLARRPQITFFSYFSSSQRHSIIIVTVQIVKSSSADDRVCEKLRLLAEAYFMLK